MSRSPSQGSNKPPRTGGQSASRQSEKGAMQSAKSSSGKHSALSVIESVVNPNHNPFTIPHDNDVFMLRDKERQKKRNRKESSSEV